MVDNTRSAVVSYVSPTAGRSRQLAVLAVSCFLVLFPLPLVFPILVSARLYTGLVHSALIAISISSLLFLLYALNSYRSNRQSRLILTSEGLTIPGRGLATRSGKDDTAWSEVERIAVDRAARFEDAVLSLSVDRAVPIKLKLSSLAPEELDKLVSAMDLWANQTSMDASFRELVENVAERRLGSDEGSFTALWMEEAQRRLSTTPFVPLSPGATLQDGRVRVVQPLTAGGWSAIYLCKWKEKTPAILKEAVVPPAAADALKKKAREHFQRESVILSGLSHPQIARVFDYFVENERQYMILERISGANIRNYVKDRGIASEKQAVKWGMQLVEIVEHLHKQDPPIIHRDLTPENLVLDMRGSLVLIDFGAANQFVGTVTGTLVGKPSYISPEQFSGHATLQSDIYSIGAVLSFMLTGVDPEPLTVASPRKTNSHVSEALDDLIGKMTQLDLVSRTKSIDEVKTRLGSIA